MNPTHPRTRGPRRPRRAVIAALLPLAGLLALGPVPPAVAQPAGTTSRCEQASAEAPIRVEVTTLAPRAPQRADEPFQIAGELVNCGQEPVDNLELRLGVGPRIDTRSGLALADEEPVVGARKLTGAPSQVQLQPGAATPFDLRLTVGELELGDRNGVFPLTLQVRARVGDEVTRGQVGLASTFVPWLPDGPVAPTRIAWLLPLVDQPRRGPDEVLLDEAYSGLLDPQADGALGGRLLRALESGTTGTVGACDLPAQLTPEAAVADAAATTEAAAVAAAAAATGSPASPVVAEPCRGEAVPVTYAVDPDLLGSVEAMTRPYTVRAFGVDVVRPPSADAQRWLTRLRTAATSGSAVLALPYGDPDVVALTRPGSPVQDDVAALTELGQTETTRLLGVPPLPTLAWLPPGPLGSSVDSLGAGGASTLVLAESSFPAADPQQGRTPHARTTVTSATGPVNALVADEALSRLVEPDRTARTWQGERLAEQRWIAEAAALTAERPGSSRTILVAPRRTADLLPSVAAAAIADTGRLPWLCPVSLAAAAAGTERCAPPTGTQGPADTQDPAASEPRGTPVSRTANDAELSTEFVAALGEIRTDSDQFTGQVLVTGTGPARETEARLLRARGRTATTAWRSERGGQVMLRLLREEVATLRGKVQLVISQPVLLTGSSGTIRLVVQNELDQPVNVGVGLPRNPAARLESSDTALQVVPARQAVQVSIRVDVRTSGRFTVRASLVDAAGEPFGEQVELPVRSTQYGRVALGITGLAAAVLLGAVGVRLTRRARRRVGSAA